MGWGWGWGGVGVETQHNNNATADTTHACKISLHNTTQSKLLNDAIYTCKHVSCTSDSIQYTYVRTYAAVCVAREGAGTGGADHYTTHFNLYLPSNATQAREKAYRVLARSGFSEPLVWVK